MKEGYARRLSVSCAAMVSLVWTSQNQDFLGSTFYESDGRVVVDE